MAAFAHVASMRTVPVQARCWFALITASFATASASAEVPSRQTGDIHRRMPEEAAQCLAEKGSSVVVAWLNTLPASVEERKVVANNELLLTRCLRTTTAGMLSWAAEYDYPAIRSRVVQYLVKNGIVRLPAESPPELARTNWFITGSRDPLPLESIIANDLGFCLAKTKWPTVRLAVQAEPRSVNEADHLRALIPLVGGCIPPSAKLRMDLPRLRAVLDETAYHAAGGASVEVLARRRPRPRKPPPVPGRRKSGTN